MHGRGKWFVAPILLIIVIVIINVAYYNRKRKMLAENALLEKKNISVQEEKQEGKEEVSLPVAELPPSSKVHVPSEEKSGIFVIQVASFRKKSRASLLVKELEKEGYNAYIVEKDLKDKGIWQRVWVGNFSDKKEASSILDKLKKMYPHSFLVYKKPPKK